MSEKEKSMILYCDCANTEIINPETKKIVKEALEKSGQRILAVDDLCGKLALKAPALQDLKNVTSLKIVACYPRAVRWLLETNDIQLPENVEFFNMREPESLHLEALQPQSDEIEINKIPFTTTPETGDWIPWFPVIDYDRCRNCKQCASFCLFGTYEIDDSGKVYVKNPQNCKNNCPACARICPEAAIIFPKLEESPINGNEIQDEAAVKEKIKLNVEQMLGDDVYAALAKRQEKKRKLFRQKEAMAKALREREKYLGDSDENSKMNS